MRAAVDRRHPALAGRGVPPGVPRPRRGPRRARNLEGVRRVVGGMGPPHAPARGSIGARAVARVILGVVVLIAVLIALWPTAVRGATPTPSAEPADPFPTVETWID